MYTIEDAKREINEMITDGDGMMVIRIFINDLIRGKDITHDEGKELNRYVAERISDPSLKTL